MKDINITDPAEPFTSHPTAYNVMLGFLYTGLFLSISATVTPLIITEMFSELPLSAARRKASNTGEASALHKDGNITESLPALLRRYGMRAGLRPVQWHCEYSSMVRPYLRVNPKSSQVVLSVFQHIELVLFTLFLFPAQGSSVLSSVSRYRS